MIDVKEIVDKLESDANVTIESKVIPPALQGKIPSRKRTSILPFRSYVYVGIFAATDDNALGQVKALLGEPDFEKKTTGSYFRLRYDGVFQQTFVYVKKPSHS